MSYTELTGFPSSTLPRDEDALVLVLVPQGSVGLICQRVAERNKKKEKTERYRDVSCWSSVFSPDVEVLVFNLPSELCTFATCYVGPSLITSMWLKWELGHMCWTVFI